MVSGNSRGTDNGSGTEPPRNGPQRRRSSPRRNRRALIQTGVLVGVLLASGIALKAVGDSGTPVSAEIRTTAPSKADNSSTPTSPSNQAPSSDAPTEVKMSVAVPKLTPAKRTKPSLKEMDRRQNLLGRERLSREEQQEASFVVAAYNVLGASHTQGKKGRKGFGSAGARMPGQIGMLEAKGVSVAGVQEFQMSQATQFLGMRGGSWSMYPGTGSGHLDVENSVIWRTDTWSLVRGQKSPIPYFGGTPRNMPQVLLEHRASGQQVWFGSFHNPADVHGAAGHLRAQAVAREVSLANDLNADGTPVIFTGDMNAWDEFICPFSAGTGMRSPDGSGQSGGGCHTARGASVDWIVGTDEMDFSNYSQDWSSKSRGLSDHPLITATATLPARGKEPGCVTAQTKAGKQRYCPVREDSDGADE